MKRKLLATLKVWETDDPKCTSGLQASTKNNAYDIVLCPHSKNGDAMLQHLERTDQKDILAHELGHFVAQILNLPEMEKDRVRIGRNIALGYEPIARPMVPVEAEAWEIADGIVPKASHSPAHEKGIAGYEQHDKHLNKLLREAKPEDRLLLSDAVAFGPGKDTNR